MIIFTLLLCPIFILIILKSIFLFFNKKHLKIIISILIIIFDLFLLFLICNYMGWSFPGSYIFFILLNIAVIILIYFIKYFIKSKHKLLILIIISVSFITLFSINIIKYIIENDQNNIIKINSSEIINNFNIYGINASKEYKGKIIEIKGIIINKEIPKDYRPLWDASCIYFGDDINAETKIICYFDNIVYDLIIGQEIIVRCKFKEYSENYKFGNYIKFNKGKIVK